MPAANVSIACRGARCRKLSKRSTAPKRQCVTPESLGHAHLESLVRKRGASRAWRSSASPVVRQLKILYRKSAQGAGGL
jgi:hypothetical protein